MLDKLAARVAPPSVKQHLAEQEAERERREQAWRDEQAAKLAEQRAKLAAGEPVRCACCFEPISTPTTPPRSTAASSTEATASSNGAAPTDRSDARRPREALMHRPPDLVTSIARETQMHLDA